MTIQADPSQIPYAGDGTTVAFAIPFPFDTSADIKVVLTDSDGTPALLATGYSITGGGGSTGTCTMDVAPAIGETLTIFDDPELTQPADYTTNDSFPADAHEAALDRTVRQVKRLKQRVDRSIRVQDGDNSDGDDLLLPLEEARAGKYLAFDANGDPVASDGTGGGDSSLRTDLASAVASSDGARLSGYRRTETGASARTVYEKLEESISALDFDAVGDGSTDVTTELQRAITAAAASKRTLVIPQGSGYYRLTGRLTAPAGTHIVLQGAELRWTATALTGSPLLGSTTRPGLEVEGSDFSIVGVGKLRGPSSATFVAGEIGIFSKGTSSASRFENFLVGPGIQFEKWGYTGVTLQYWNNIDLPQFRAFDCGHGGFIGFSCGRGRAFGIDVDTIGPGSSGQCYGFSLTHDSTGYSSDPDIATPRLVANPFCNDWEVTGTIANVPTWQGFDAHGGYEIRVHHMATFNCRHGISLSGSSGDALNYAGANNSIDHVYVTTKKRDGSATTVSATDRNGIVINGGSTVRHENVSLDHFVIDGYGDNVVSSMSLQAIRIVGGRISHGSITNWKGYGISLFDGTGSINDVLFGAVADATNSICVRHNFSSVAGQWDVYGCRHRAGGGTVASEGLRIATGNSRAVVLGNDFSEATTPYAGDTLTLTKGSSDVLPTLSVSGTPTAVDLTTAGLHRTPRVRVTLDVSGNSTIADITGAYIGQIIEFYAPTTNTTTFDQTNSALAANTDWTSSQFDTLVLECVNTTGTKFVERSRSANS